MNNYHLELKTDNEGYRVNVCIKKINDVYFNETIVYDRSINPMLFLFASLLGFALLLLYVLYVSVFYIKNGLLCWIFKEDDLITAEEAEYRLNEKPLFESLTVVQKEELLRPKDLPLNL